MNTSFVLMLISASTLPLLAFLTLLLRRNFIQGVYKIVLLIAGFILLSFAVFDTLKEHAGNLLWSDIVIGAITACVTIFILSRFSHGHTHASSEEGAKGIVVSEAFHSLIDGAVIGATYLVSPILGYAATIGIITHELPKIIGTLTILRGLGLSIRSTILYGIFAQIGSPVAALFIYLLGKEFNHAQFQSLEIASVSSLAAIILWIIYLEIQHHINHPKKGDHSNHNH